MGVGEDLGPLLFGQCPCVSDWRGAIVDNCTTESCGIDTAIFNPSMEKERETERERERGGEGEREREREREEELNMDV